MIRATCLQALAALPLQAEVLPALHAVTDVAADDVLNIRAAPSAEAPVLGTFAPDATGIEVIAIVDGWAMVNAGEQVGYTAARYLTREPGPDWTTLQVPLNCMGTEPFWSLKLTKDQTTFESQDAPKAETWQIGQTWPGQPWDPVSAFVVPGGFAVLAPSQCSDGMSDRVYGISINLFRSTPANERLYGCCLLE